MATHPKEQSRFERSRNAAEITIHRIKSYDELYASTLQEGNDMFAEKTRELWQQLAVHGVLGQDKEGKTKLLEYTDLDGNGCIELLKMAGIRHKFTFTEKGSWRDGYIHFDTGGRHGLIIEDGGKTAFFDHHTSSYGMPTSASEITYQALIDMGLLKKEEWLDNMVKFITQVDNRTYPHEADYWKYSWRTVLGLQRYLNSKHLVEYFRSGRDPTILLSENDLSKMGLLKASLKQKAIVEKSFARLAEMEREGLVINSPRYGKIAVDIGKTVAGGFEAAKAHGCDGYIIWKPDDNGFFVSMSKSIAITPKEGVLVRGTMWIKPQDDLPRQTKLSEIITQLAAPITPQGKLLEYLVEELKNDLTARLDKGEMKAAEYAQSMARLSKETEISLKEMSTETPTTPQQIETDSNITKGKEGLREEKLRALDQTIENIKVSASPKNTLIEALAAGLITAKEFKFLNATLFATEKKPRTPRKKKVVIPQTELDAADALLGKENQPPKPSMTEQEAQDMLLGKDTSAEDKRKEKEAADMLLGKDPEDERREKEAQDMLLGKEIPTVNIPPNIPPEPGAITNIPNVPSDLEARIAKQRDWLDIVRGRAERSTLGINGDSAEDVRRAEEELRRLESLRPGQEASPIQTERLENSPSLLGPEFQNRAAVAHQEAKGRIQKVGGWFKERLKGFLTLGFTEFKQARNFKKATERGGDEIKSMVNRIQETHNLSLSASEEYVYAIDKMLEEQGLIQRDVQGRVRRDITPDEYWDTVDFVTAKRIRKNDETIKKIVDIEINNLRERLKDGKWNSYKTANTGESVFVSEKLEKMRAELTVKLKEMQNGQARKDEVGFAKIIRTNLDKNWWARRIYGTADVLVWLSLLGAGALNWLGGKGVAGSAAATERVVDHVKSSGGLDGVQIRENPWNTLKEVAHALGLNPTDAQMEAGTKILDADNGIYEPDWNTGDTTGLVSSRTLPKTFIFKISQAALRAVGAPV